MQAYFFLCLECLFFLFLFGFPGGASGKESTCLCRRSKKSSVIFGLGRSPGEGHGNPLQYSCLENPMDSGAWWATAHGLQRVGHDWATELNWTERLNIHVLQMAYSLHWHFLSYDFFVVVENWTFESNDVVTMRIRFCWQNLGSPCTNAEQKCGDRVMEKSDLISLLEITVG